MRGDHLFSPGPYGTASQGKGNKGIDESSLQRIHITLPPVNARRGDASAWISWLQLSDVALTSHGAVVKEVWDTALQTARDEDAKYEATHPDMRQTVRVIPRISPQHTMVEAKIRTALLTAVSDEIRELALSQQKATTAELLFELHKSVEPGGTGRS